jgi:hypothetical protein
VTEQVLNNILCRLCVIVLLECGCIVHVDFFFTVCVAYIAVSVFRVKEDVVHYTIFMLENVLGHRA